MKRCWAATEQRAIGGTPSSTQVEAFAEGKVVHHRGWRLAKVGEGEPHQVAAHRARCNVLAPLCRVTRCEGSGADKPIVQASA